MMDPTGLSKNDVAVAKLAMKINFSQVIVEISGVHVASILARSIISSNNSSRAWLLCANPKKSFAVGPVFVQILGAG